MYLFTSHKILKFPIRSLQALVATVVITAFTSGVAAAGSPAYNFLNIASSAKAYGLGGVNISTIGGGLDMVEQNPALIGPEIGSVVSANYTRYFGNSNFTGLKFGHSAGERSAYAVGVQYFGYGKFDGYDETGVSTGSFTSGDIVISGSMSHDFTTNLRGGATVKFAFSAYERYNAIAIATDLGINYYDDEHDLSLSAVIANLGGQVKRFTDRYDRLPTDVRLGWSQQLGTLPVRWNVTAWNLTKWSLPYYENGADENTDSTDKKKDSFGSNLMRHLVLGADIIPSDKFYLSLGYNYKVRTDMSTYDRNFFSGVYLGAGIDVDAFSVDVAFSQPHTGGTTLLFNISTELSKLIK